MMRLFTVVATTLLSVACTGTALPPLGAEHPANPDAEQAPGKVQSVALGTPVMLPTATSTVMDHAHDAQNMPGTAGSDTERGSGMATPGDMHGEHAQAMATPGDMHGEHGQAMAAPGDAPGHAHEGHDMHWMAPKEAAARANPVAATLESIAQGKGVFASNCVACHGQNGDGNGPLAQALNPKPANLAAMASEHPDGDFAWKVANGRGAMPAWKEVLSEQDIWHVVNYIKTLGPGSKSHPAKQPQADGHAHDEHPQHDSGGHPQHAADDHHKDPGHHNGEPADHKH